MWKFSRTDASLYVIAKLSFDCCSVKIGGGLEVVQVIGVKQLCGAVDFSVMAKDVLRLLLFHDFEGQGDQCVTR